MCKTFHHEIITMEISAKQASSKTAYSHTDCHSIMGFCAPRPAKCIFCCKQKEFPAAGDTVQGRQTQFDLF